MFGQAPATPQPQIIPPAHPPHSNDVDDSGAVSPAFNVAAAARGFYLHNSPVLSPGDALSAAPSSHPRAGNDPSQLTSANRLGQRTDATACRSLLAAFTAERADAEGMPGQNF